MTESEPASLRALAYAAAVDAGLEPRSYAWQGVPEGTWIGRLDFKTWANTTAQGHMVCYFTAASDGRRYRLSAFRSGASYRYRYTSQDVAGGDRVIPRSGMRQRTSPQPGPAANACARLDQSPVCGGLVRAGAQPDADSQAGTATYRWGTGPSAMAASAA